MAKIQELFPSLLSSGRLSRATALNRQLKREIEILTKIDEEGLRWSKKHYIGGYSSYGSLTQLHRTSPNFADLEKALAPLVRQMVRKLEWDLGGRSLEMTTCWANRMGPGTHHTLHLHPHSVLSGVYFVDCPPGSSIFKIEDPRMSQLMAAPPRKANCQSKNRNYIEFQPKAGEYLLFESWMKHEVPPNRSRKPRLSISFNYEWV
jgi:uncharacterized protein (TIGR02466 family)